MATALIICGLVIGWQLELFNRTIDNKRPAIDAQVRAIEVGAGKNVAAMVGFELPANWNRELCPVSGTIIYIVPVHTSLACSASPRAPIKAYVDQRGILSCLQLTPAGGRGIRTHVCQAHYIDGHKSIQSTTSYSAGLAYKTATTVSDYYLNTGQGVAVFEYTYTSVNNYQDEFDHMATTAKVIS